MAPEVARGGMYARSADVHSFAMLLFELITHEVPFARLAPMQVAIAVTCEHRRPKLPDNTPLALAALVEGCWHIDADMRPTSGEIVRDIAHLRGALTDAEASWLSEPWGHPSPDNRPPTPP